jgi:colanic acid biosynthesis protein WcaH
MFLPEDTFKTVIASTPLISIDLVVKNNAGHYLLGYRNNKPAQGYWFVPGGRILKGEHKNDAFSRLVKAELGIDMVINEAIFDDVYEHFYDDYVFGDEVSTHYIVLAYQVVIDIKLTALPDEQHSQYKWFTKEQLLLADNVHKHSKWYVDKSSK